MHRTVKAYAFFSEKEIRRTAALPTDFFFKTGEPLQSISNGLFIKGRIFIFPRHNETIFTGEGAYNNSIGGKAWSKRFMWICFF